MSDYIEVIERKKVPRNCTTCLYNCNGWSCGHASNSGKPMLMVNGGKSCGYYWLDQHRFQRAD